MSKKAVVGWLGGGGGGCGHARHSWAAARRASDRGTGRAFARARAREGWAEEFDTCDVLFCYDALKRGVIQI